MAYDEDAAGQETTVLSGSLVLPDGDVVETTPFNRNVVVPAVGVVLACGNYGDVVRLGRPFSCGLLGPHPPAHLPPGRPLGGVVPGPARGEWLTGPTVGRRLCPGEVW